MGIDDFMPSLDGDSSAIGSIEATREAAEQYRENAKKAATQAKQDQKEERKKKVQDSTLADIIVQFLKDKRFTGMFLLISRNLQKNIPSDFLLAILSLIHKDSAQVLKEKMETQIKISSLNVSEVFPPELAKPLQEWINLINTIASTQPHKVLESILDHEWKIEKNTSHLMAKVLQQFFIFKKFETPYQKTEEFCEVFLKKLSKRLENQVQNQNILS